MYHVTPEVRLSVMHLKAGFATAAEEECEETAALKIIKYDELM